MKNSKKVENTIMDEATDMPTTLNIPSNDGFESVADIIPFWDYKTSPVLVGLFQGEGNEVGDGTHKNKTWLFSNEQGEFLVPQWAMLNDLNGVPSGKFIYRLTYRGMYERADGGKFHQLKVERKMMEGAQ